METRGKVRGKPTNNLGVVEGGLRLQRAAWTRSEKKILPHGMYYKLEVIIFVEGRGKRKLALWLCVVKS